MTLKLTIEIHVLQKRAYLTYSAIKVVYTAFTYTCNAITHDDSTNVPDYLMRILVLKDDILHSLKKSTFCLKTSYLRNK